MLVISDVSNQAGFVAADVENGKPCAFSALPALPCLERQGAFLPHHVCVWKHLTHLVKRLEISLHHQITPAAKSGLAVWMSLCEIVESFFKSNLHWKPGSIEKARDDGSGDACYPRDSERLIQVLYLGYHIKN